MKKRYLMLLGFVFGYFWHASKPVRKFVFQDVIVSYCRDAMSEVIKMSESDVPINYQTLFKYHTPVHPTRRASVQEQRMRARRDAERESQIQGDKGTN